jgi:hypothetical protein
MPASPLSLSQPATHVEVNPGGEIILRGSFLSTHDGSVIDAASTTWPAGAPGGASVDAGGLVDLEAGGFHLTSRDPVTHEVHAVAVQDGATACAALGVAAPCLPLRLQAQGTSRLLTASSWQRTLKGAISVDVPVPPVYAPAVAAATSYAPYLKGALGLVLLVAALAGWRSWRARQARSPQAQLLALAERVRAKASLADPIVAAPLAPALSTTLKKLQSGSVDPTSAEGVRVRAMLEKVSVRLDQTAEQLKSQREREVVDELAHDLESALDAADETLALDQRIRR